MLDGDSPSPISDLPPCPASVRIAGPADEPRVFDLLWTHLRADNFMGIPPDESRVWANVNATCRGQGGICGVIDAADGTLAGSIAIVAFQPWYSAIWHLSQVWAFVRPEHRKGTRYGTDLFDFARWHRADMARRLGYDIGLENSVMSFKRLAAKERLWATKARKAGAIFWIGGDHG